MKQWEQKVRFSFKSNQMSTRFAASSIPTVRTKPEILPLYLGGLGGLARLRLAVRWEHNAHAARGTHAGEGAVRGNHSRRHEVRLADIQPFISWPFISVSHEDSFAEMPINRCLSSPPRKTYVLALLCCDFASVVGLSDNAYEQQRHEAAIADCLSSRCHGETVVALFSDGGNFDASASKGEILEKHSSGRRCAQYQSRETRYQKAMNVAHLSVAQLPPEGEVPKNQSSRYQAKARGLAGNLGSAGGIIKRLDD